MWDFYKRYAYGVGFPVRKRNSKKKNGSLRYVTFTCCREGKYWIEEQCGEMSSMYSSSVKNLMPQHTAPNPSENKNIGAIRDPVLSKRKDAPRKLRRKNPLESRSHKVKATSASSKGKSQRKIYSDLQTDDTSVQDAILRDFSVPATFSYSKLLMPIGNWLEFTEVGLTEIATRENKQPITQTNLEDFSQRVEQIFISASALISLDGSVLFDVAKRDGVLLNEWKEVCRYEGDKLGRSLCLVRWTLEHAAAGWTHITCIIKDKGLADQLSKRHMFKWHIHMVVEDIFSLANQFSICNFDYESSSLDCGS
ncbi:FAR1-related protein [Striga asiatica]|uniref:FAR1-related protein n=1 Tax=Striga asiatica TaxID=4170 RepID=A0A5A7PN93_STRAF|nr:FAR1-related protein [Striga asiatica]